MKSTPDEFEAHLATLRKTPLLIDSIAEALTERQLRLVPAPGAWPLVEVLAHLHACAEVWGDDIGRMLAHDSPRFSKPHPRKVMQASRHLEPSFAESSQAFAVLRGRLIELLESLGPEQWERDGVINGRHHTVYTHTRRVALHEAVHTEQIRETWQVISQLEPKRGG